MPEPNPENSNETINAIVNEIESGKCILIMGPEFYFLNNNDDDEIECINDHLDKVVNSATSSKRPGSNSDADNVDKPDKAPIKYLKDEGLFYCETDEQLSSILFSIRTFYHDLKPNPLYEKIAQIPFSLYFSLSPDTVLDKTFYNLGFKKKFSYYLPGTNTSGNGSGQEQVEVSRSSPLIYNLMGKYDERHSLVFSYETLFWFIATIFQKESPELTALKNCFYNASYFLFMGFRFDKWYLKLLFFLFKKVLQTPDNYKTSKKIAYLFKKPGIEDNILNYYKSEFKLEFPTESQKEFLEKVYQICNDRGILRKTDNSGSSEINEIEIYIRKGDKNEAIRRIKRLNYSRECDEAITALRILLQDDKDNLEELDQISGDIAYYTKQKSRKLMTDEVYETNLSRIRDRIGDILKSLT